MWHRIVALTLLFAGVSSAEPASYVFPPNGRFIFPVALGKALLHPCSRSVPKSISAFWEPSEADIDSMEKQLVDYMMGLERADSLRPPAASYSRQYIGIVEKGTKLIYGNYFPPSFSRLGADRHPIDICHGGPRIWSIVFNPKTNSFTYPSFNGPG